MTDPWSVQKINEVKPNINPVTESANINTRYKNADLEGSQTLGFEDSFIQHHCSLATVHKETNISKTAIGDHHQPLPDSKTYLQNLERKLEKLKKGSKLVDALSEKREDFLRSMLQNNSSTVCNNEQLLELDTNINNPESTVQILYRQLRPVQPVTIGETVHIVQYDQLEEQRLEDEAKEIQEESLPASR